MTRRDLWVLTGIGFNTVASLTAIALWALAPQRGAAPLECPPGTAAVSPPPRRAFQETTLPGRPPARLPRSAAAPPDDRPAGAAPDRGAPLLQKQTGEAPVSASVVALGERLHLNPQALALQLGDEHGEVPKAWASRLELSFTRAEALARRLDLDESRTQSLVALTTYHVFSKLREEKAAPGGVDPARLEALTDALLNDIRVTCGEDVAAAAKSDLAAL
jgi:hypothetical protein